MRAMKFRRQALAAVVLACLSWGAGSPFAQAVSPSPPFIPSDANWLTVVNYYRAMSGLAPVVDDAALSAGAFNHSCYMLQNGISHDELPGNPGYTVNGDSAGNNGNVAVSSAFNTTARSHIELWMTGPFHAIGVLRPNLQTVGFGKCDNQTTPLWHSGGTLDVLHGLVSAPAPTAPILFPGDGTTTNLDRFIVETPDPLSFCGWTGPAGLPIIAMMPEDVASTPSASVVIGGVSQQVCVLTKLNTTSTASAILAGNNAVIVIPRNPLPAGQVNVSVATASRTVNWNFFVDPAAANGVIPVVQTTPLGAGTAFQPVTPNRVVDTRINQGATRLVGSLQKRIQITGLGTIPSTAKAISANFTVVNPQGSAYLTVWNCDARPVASTLNFAAGEVVPNGASVALDATGGICVYSPVSTDVLVDVNGYFSASGTGFFTPVVPDRLLDSRFRIRSAGRLANGETQVLQIRGLAGVPANATAVALNVTSVLPSVLGFVTVYPCDVARPTVSNLNPAPGAIKPNVVLTPIGADGTICLYTSTSVDLFVDVTGFISPTVSNVFTPTSPFRFTDTRERFQPALNNGKDGATMKAGEVIVIQVAGVRGVATGAKAIAANITVVGGTGTGYITAWPCGPQPSTSNVNFSGQDAVANGAQLPLSATGQLCLYSSAEVHVIMDIAGWWG